MASAGEKAKSTIVIKRIKKGGHASHGGVWKIAYADFVTAMMAFFLLMWLLGSTTKGDLKGIADYFASPLQVAMMGGSGAGDATSVIQGGGASLTERTGQVKRGETDTEKKRRRAEAAKRERKRMEALKERVDAAILANPKLAELQHQIRVEITPDGLRIQIVDDFKRPMFALGGAKVEPYMRELLREIGTVLNQVDNKLVLTGHTDAAPYGGGERGYSNWELSADRANASRRELLAGGMAPTKIVRVVGLADSALLDKADPRNPLNRRISIIVLNKLAEARMNEAGGEIEAGTADSLKELLPGEGSTEAGAENPVSSAVPPDAPAANAVDVTAPPAPAPIDAARPK
ncbi:MAG TPA: flagellar motor protein MotB [Burkholderiaceae bacterium]|nr:flagellar motor protein MotB [Burkholderiaceae bacterium]